MGVVTEFRPIVRSGNNEQLTEIVPVGQHKPEWEGMDCPSCGSAPCGPHPDLLACQDCGEEWPCQVVRDYIADLNRMAQEARTEYVQAARASAQCVPGSQIARLQSDIANRHFAVFSRLSDRANELRGGA